MKKSKIIPKKQQEIVIYRSSRGNVTLRADLNKDTIWATQANIAQLFDINRTVVTKHINNLLKNREIDEKSNVQKMHIANSDKPVSFYSLDMILSIGYRTNSKRAIVFRQWATETLHEYIIHGMAVNTERISNLRKNDIDNLKKEISRIQNTIRRL